MKTVSIIIPCLNEEKFIGPCLDSVLGNGYPHDKLEIFVVDGMSDDGTRDIIRSYEERFPFIHLLDNPKRLTPVAMNVGIRSAEGEVIVRMDAHTTYQEGYISKCVDALDTYNADNVGGIIKTRPGRDTLIGKAIALTLAHPFGVGRSRFRTSKRNVPFRDVDTVPFGCFRRELFERVGLFNENLTVWHGRCNEDFDLNQRIKMSGGKIILVSAIESSYYAKGTLATFWRHSYDNGVLITLPLATGEADFSFRHLVPLIFIVSLIGLIVTASISGTARYLLIAMCTAYIALSVYFSFKTVLRQKDWRYFLLMPGTFALLHAAYGSGSITGLARAVWIKLRIFTRRFMLSKESLRT